MRFLVYGDDRSDERRTRRSCAPLERRPSDFLVNTGDFVADGGERRHWAGFFHIEEPLLRDRALFSAIGNHELYDDQAGSNFARYFGFPDASGTPQPYGTMRWGSVRFFFLNGMHDWNAGPERAVAREGARPTPTASRASCGASWSCITARGRAGLTAATRSCSARASPSCSRRTSVDLVLGGPRPHLRARHGDALKYVISGGGGAPLYPIEHRIARTRKVESAHHYVEITATTRALKLVAHRIDGSVLDECGFEKGKPWDCDAPPPAPPAGASLSSAPASEPPSTSRCGCVVPGADPPAGVWAAALLSCVAVGAARARRRRG